MNESNSVPAPAVRCPNCCRVESDLREALGTAQLYEVEWAAESRLNAELRAEAAHLRAILAKPRDPIGTKDVVSSTDFMIHNLERMVKERDADNEFLRDMLKEMETRTKVLAAQLKSVIDRFVDSIERVVPRGDKNHEKYAEEAGGAGRYEIASEPRAQP